MHLFHVLTESKNPSLTDRMLIQALAILSADARYSHLTPEQIYDEVHKQMKAATEEPAAEPAEPAEAKPAGIAVNWMRIPVHGFDTFMEVAETRYHIQFSASVTRQNGQKQFRAYFCDGEHTYSKNFDVLSEAQDYVAGIWRARHI